MDINRCAEVMAYHGALGERREGNPPTERERMRCSRLVFHLIPNRALIRTKVDDPIKPLIVERINNLGLIASDDAIAVLKEVADQYFRTSALGLEMTGYRPRKLGVRDLRLTNQVLLKKIRQAQDGRCAVCGVPFSSNQETLDHIIPWRLIGDVADGSNYQLLCKECNSAKCDLLSCLQSNYVNNWMYSIVFNVDGDDLLKREGYREIRFSRLSLSGKCETAGCNATPRNSRLLVCKKDLGGLWCFANSTARCEQHASGEMLSYDNLTAMTSA